VKRPILGLLAAVILSFGLFGAPSGAATSNAKAAMMTPAHEGHDHDADGGYKYSHPHSREHHGTRHHWRHHHDDDGDHDDAPCSGLIVICL
jgi:hypothetical protein